MLYVGVVDDPSSIWVDVIKCKSCITRNFSHKSGLMSDNVECEMLNVSINERERIDWIFYHDTYIRIDIYSNLSLWRAAIL